MVRAHPVTFFRGRGFRPFSFVRNSRAKNFKMYYHKSMKKTVLVLGMCLLSVWTGAQSTCETRVDAHPHASTSQRVDYCLNGNQDAVYNNPGLVFSGVTPRHPAAEQSVGKPTAREGNFKQEQVTVSQNFVETRQFPKFTDGHVSQQEIWDKRRAVYQGQIAGQEAAEQAACEPQEESILAPAVKETKKGIAARTKKPGRRLMQVTAQETTLQLTEPEMQEVAPASEEYTYDTASTQPSVPATPDAQEYIPAAPEAQEYTPTEVAAEPYAPYAPAGQEEIPVGTSSYAPAN